MAVLVVTTPNHFLHFHHKYTFMYCNYFFLLKFLFLFFIFCITCLPCVFRGCVSSSIGTFLRDYSSLLKELSMIYSQEKTPLKKTFDLSVLIFAVIFYSTAAVFTVFDTPAHFLHPQNQDF